MVSGSWFGRVGRGQCLLCFDVFGYGWPTYCLTVGESNVHTCAYNRDVTRQEFAAMKC